MRLITITIFIIILITSCQKNDLENSNLPVCIQTLVEDNPSLKIHSQVVDNKPHYWLNTGALQVNDSEFVVNEQCDTVCLFPFGFAIVPCFYDYDGEWEQVWP